MPSLTPHPRLYIDQTAIDRLKRRPKVDVLVDAADTVAILADEFARTPHFEWSQLPHNAHLLRARQMQRRVVTLLTRWTMTSDETYRQAAIDHLYALGDWEYWSWIKWRQNDPDPMAIYDLSYGENNATLAIGYTWLHDTLTDEQKKHLQRVAADRGLRPFIKFTTARQPASWFKRTDSNWNSVCAGGAGMLALAMHDDLPEARQALPLAEESIKPFMDELKRTQGGWIEGLGYWNYGMRYAFMYLLSHERATGRKHPLMHAKATKASLHWPLFMTPHSRACAFGDGNKWAPMPFHFAAAADVGDTELLAQLHERYSYMRDMQKARAPLKDASFGGPWPHEAELLLFHPGQVSRKKPMKTRNVAHLYKGLDWAVLADQMPEPKLYAAIRAGQFPAPHSQKDLSSFHLVVDGERLIESLNSRGYLDTTFSPRRYELFELSYRSKNVLLINGVGMAEGNAPIAPLSVGRLSGFRIDMTGVMGPTRDHAACSFYARAFFMLPNAAGLLIVDRVDLQHVGQIETQLYTHHELNVSPADRAQITGDSSKLQIACAGDFPARMFTALPPTTLPPVDATADASWKTVEQGQPRLLRYCADELGHGGTIVTLLSRGSAKPKIQLDTSGKLIEITVSASGAKGAGYNHSLKLTKKLKAARK